MHSSAEAPAGWTGTASASRPAATDVEPPAHAGAPAERNVSAQMGMEYVVETVNGNLMTVVQGAEPAFAPGIRVLVLYGSPARVIADPRSAPGQ